MIEKLAERVEFLIQFMLEKFAPLERTTQFERKEFLTVMESAEYLNVHPRTIYRYQQKGLIFSELICGTQYFAKKELIQVVKVKT